MAFVGFRAMVRKRVSALIATFVIAASSPVAAETGAEPETNPVSGVTLYQLLTGEQSNVSSLCWTDQCITRMGVWKQLSLPCDGWSGLDQRQAEGVAYMVQKAEFVAAGIMATEPTSVSEIANAMNEPLNYKDLSVRSRDVTKEEYKLDYAANLGQIQFSIGEMKYTCDSNGTTVTKGDLPWLAKDIIAGRLIEIDDDMVVTVSMATPQSGS